MGVSGRSVILFRPKYDPNAQSAPVLPWALLYLAAALVPRGIRCHIVDEVCTPDCDEHVRRLLDEEKPLAFGITSMTGDQIRFGLACAQRVRAQSPGLPIVWGGIHPSLLPEQTAAHPLVDYAVAGEGEEAFPALLTVLADGGDPCSIPGVYGKDAHGAVTGTPPAVPLDFASIPPVPFDLVDIERYISRRSDLGAKRYFEVCTSRGCPHHCGFCYIERVHGSRWRALDADAAVARITENVQRFNLDCVSFREDNFFVNRKRVEAIAQGLIDAKLDIKWAGSCRINYFAKYDDAFVDLLRRSGCVLLTFGVESGSNRVLDFIRKEISIDMVLATARRLQRAGIRGTYHFMGGFPGETESEFLDTCRLIESLRQTDPAIVVREMSIFAPYPGVGLIAECVKRGYSEPQSLEEWIRMDWANPSRPWLTPAQSRLISDAQFLIARLAHPNAAVRAWVNRRWRQLLASRKGIILHERPLFETLRNLRHRQHA